MTATKNAGRLSRVVSGKQKNPVRVVLYGTDGLGKSTWASKAPSPIFIGAEDGTANLDVDRLPDVGTWLDILAAVSELAAEEHDYKTVVLDTADWAEPLCWAEVAAQAKKPDIEAIGYGKGYVAALDQWRVLLSKLERLSSKKGMHVIILAHSWIKSFKNPENAGDYDRFELKLHPKAAGLLREWSEAVLFGKHETFTTETNGRIKGVSTGARVVHTECTAAWDAKNRYNLPPTLPLEWDAFYSAVEAHQSGTTDTSEVTARIAELSSALDDDTKAKVAGAVERAGGDAATLARIANKLAAKVQKEG